MCKLIYFLLFCVIPYVIKYSHLNYRAMTIIFTPNNDI